MNKNKLIELYTSKLFDNRKDKSSGNDFHLDNGLSTLNSKFVDETVNSCSNILVSSVSKATDCRSNLSTPQISEEYDQIKNIQKKLEEQPGNVSQQLHDNCNSLKSNNKLLH